MSSRTLFGVLASLVAVVLLMIGSMNLFENLDAGEIMVIQNPFNGNLAWYQTPGIKYQGFGKVTVYKKRSQLWFNNSEGESEQG